MPKLIFTDRVIYERIKEMTVKEFVELASNKRMDVAGIKKYVNYGEKYDIAKRLVTATCFDENNNIKLNSPSQYMLYRLSLVNTWTAIDVDFTHGIEEFDILSQNGILDDIIKKIPEKEIKEFDMLVKLIQSDLLYNTATPQAYISSQVEKFATLTNTVLSPLIEKLADEIKNLDDSKIEKLSRQINAIVKRIK